jgi:MFS family permease
LPLLPTGGRRLSRPSLAGRAQSAAPATRPGLFAGIGRTVAALSLVSMFTDLGSEMIYPLLPVFLSATLGLGTASIGLIEGMADSTASLRRLASGWLSDRIGRRQALVLAGYGLSSLARPLLGLSAAAFRPWQAPR